MANTADMANFELTADHVDAVTKFAKSHGRSWKQALSAAWFCGSDVRELGGAFLWQLRNYAPDGWLRKFKLEKQKDTEICF